MKRMLLALVLFVSVAAMAQTGPRVAVAPFVEKTYTGLPGIGPGLGEMLAQRLQNLEFFVIPPAALQALVQQFGLVPGPQTWQLAAQNLGAEVFIQGAVEKFSASSMTFTFLFFTVRGASVSTELSAQVVDFRTGESKTVSGFGTASGPASVEVTLYFPIGVCSGGFLTDKAIYYTGETVTLGYLDPAPPNSFYVVIHPVASALPSWTSPVASSTPGNPCVTWTWNQSFPPQAAPGDYVAELYDWPTSVLLATRTFTIAPAAAAELVFGTSAFTQAPWGAALGSAMDELITKLVPILRP